MISYTSTCTIPLVMDGMVPHSALRTVMAKRLQKVLLWDGKTTLWTIFVFLIPTVTLSLLVVVIGTKKSLGKLGILRIRS